MKFHELQTKRQRSAKRAGRGIAAGRGKTAGRGTKGQNARTGGGTRPGFEGGQNPLVKRLPKLPGFRSIRPKAENVYTGQLADVKGVVDNFSLFNAGITSSPYVRVKLVVKGDVSKSRDVKLQAASEKAVEMLQKAGGSFTKVEQVKRQAKE
ncbi:MAG: 50S ribosomal protein L15, partial [Candidatus Saccharibacteria bacterium]|nr:50S ribosomal protein L15 [Candidatus Saccharibacteria bacterium]